MLKYLRVSCLESGVKMPRSYLVFLIGLTITLVDAQPTCKLKGRLQKDLVCTPGKQDYELKRGLVSDNNRTTSIVLRGCRITDVQFESFNGLFNLQHLDLSMNKIQKLKLGVLDGAKQVMHLNLSHNLLTEFPLGLFDQKPNLETLDLKGNMLQTIELGVFDPLSKLRHLDLSSNLLLGSNINPNIFDKSRSIEFVDFSRNDMSGAPNGLLQAFEALDFLNLNTCSLTEVPDFARAANLRTMQHLMISNNQITTLDNPATFSNLEKLEKLNMAYNNIRSVHENIFKTLRNLKQVVLRHNELKYLPETLFEDKAKLLSIDLSNNLIEFVPVNAFRGSAVKYLNLANNRFTYLTDNFCLELKNSGVNLQKFFFNQNPWQCACLKDVLNEVKALQIDYNKLKYEGKEPVCTYNNEFNCKRDLKVNQFYVDLYFNNLKTVGGITNDT